MRWRNKGEHFWREYYTDDDFLSHQLRKRMLLCPVPGVASWLRWYLPELGTVKVPFPCVRNSTLSGTNTRGQCKYPFPSHPSPCVTLAWGSDCVVFAMSDFPASIYNWYFSVTRSVYRPFTVTVSSCFCFCFLNSACYNLSLFLLMPRLFWMWSVGALSSWLLQPSGASHHSVIITLLSGATCPWLTLY